MHIPIDRFIKMQHKRGYSFDDIVTQVCQRYDFHGEDGEKIVNEYFSDAIDDNGK